MTILYCNFFDQLENKQLIKMKIPFAFIALVFPLLLSAQRGEVPTKNPDNALDLKVVFQEYSVATYSKYGNTSQEGEYLNLKVNDMYMPEGGTGISRMHFERYLSNCPKALDLSIDGLSMYDKSNKYYKYGNYVMLTGFGIGAAIMLQPGRDFTGTDVIGGLSAALVGGIGKFILGRRGQKIEKQGDQMIVDAFDIYAQSCFDAESYTPPTNTQPSANDGIKNGGAENGESSNSEEILIDILSNNAESKFLSVGGMVSASRLDVFSVNYGPEFTYFKKGFYLNAFAYGSKTIGVDVPGVDALEFGTSLVTSIPLLKGVSQQKKSVLNLGKSQGFTTLAESETIVTDIYKSLSIDLGIDYNQQHVDSYTPETNNYFLKSTLLRGGLSRSLFAERSFKVNDNRFSDKVRHAAMVFRFYVNAVYNLNTDYQIVPKSFGDNPELETNLGYVFGIDMKFASNSKNRATSFILEGGRFPIVNSMKRWAVQLKVGYGFYSVDRAKAKSRSRNRSRR